MSARQQREEISHRDALPPRHQSVVAEPVRPTLKGLVPGISRVPTQIKTIVPKSGSTHHRIDTQVPVRRAGTVYADIECQIRDDSVAAVICPFDLALEPMRWPVDALDRDAVLEWLPEEGRGGGVYDEEEVEEELDEMSLQGCLSQYSPGSGGGRSLQPRPVVPRFPAVRSDVRQAEHQRPPAPAQGVALRGVEEAARGRT
jgi:hypothetical protein